MSAKPKKTKHLASPGKTITAAEKSTSPWLFIVPVLAFTFLLFLPMFKNGFTNWDDTLYVLQNPLLIHLNAEGLRAIFSTPVVSNYHPLTILSLALNYQIGELSPTNYWISNIILHLINTGLVFWLIYKLSAGNRWVSAFVALLFAIHPMHVESVAWISERKDLLYTLFYLAAMILYVKYLEASKMMYLVFTTLLGAISLLCKPAAIVLPLSLLLIDYFQKRKWSIQWILEKIPLFILCAVMAYVTFAIQSKRAVASADMYNIPERLCFAGFGWVWYLLKLIVPVPLSALHPFPHHLSAWYYIATLFAIAFVVYALINIRNRLFLFAFGFYTVNLLLVLQVVSIGNAVVAERYTYVPYVGILFWLGIEGYQLIQGRLANYKPILLSIAGGWILILSWMTFKHIPVWHSSQTLWQNVLDHYPDSKRAWTNKGLDLYDQKKYPEVVDHLSRAIAQDSNYLDALEWRARAYIEMHEDAKALTDALHFHRLNPGSEVAQYLLARAYVGAQQPDKAVNLYNLLISRYGKADYYNNRGVIYFNYMKQYLDAQSDFENAIRLSPQSGSYLLNLSRCYYMTGDLNNARRYAVESKALGQAIDEGYSRAIGIPYHK